MSASFSSWSFSRQRTSSSLTSRRMAAVSSSMAWYLMRNFLPFFSDSSDKSLTCAVSLSTWFCTSYRLVSSRFLTSSAESPSDFFCLIMLVTHWIFSSICKICECLSLMCVIKNLLRLISLCTWSFSSRSYALTLVTRLFTWLFFCSSFFKSLSYSYPSLWSALASRCLANSMRLSSYSWFSSWINPWLLYWTSSSWYMASISFFSLDILLVFS